MQMRVRMRFQTVLLTLTALALAGIAPRTALAQNLGTLRGTVTDPTGAVVPAASVTATNVATGVGSSTVTTDAGTYN